MKRILIQRVKEKIGQQVKITGFVHAIRDQGSIKFLIIRDISGTLQVVITKFNNEAMKIVESLSLESFTSRHDTEFTGYDAEISFIESHQDVMLEEQKVIQYALEKIKEKFGKEILMYYNRDIVAPTIPFPQVTMKEAKEILAKLKVPSEKEGDLSPEEERELSEYIKKENGHEFVFVTEYPIEIRPFYHMRLENDPKLTKSFDLLWNGLEITTGAQREHRYDVLVAQAKEKGLRLEPIQFYLNFFKYGCPPHGGFAPGPSRMLMKIFNVGNVREVTYLYRGVKRLEP